MAAELRLQKEEGERSREALDASIKESDLLSQELAASEKRCDSIQREAEVRMQSLEHQKIKTARQLRVEADQEKARAHEADARRRHAEEKLKDAETKVSRSKYELGTALREAQKLRLEQQEAEVVLDMLDGTLYDVRESHKEI